MRKLVTLILLAVALLAQQTGPVGTVNGVVTAAGAPASAIKVVLGSGTVSSFTASAVTNAQGQFTVSGVPVGPVDVKVFDAQGNLTVSGHAELTAAGQVVSLPIHLP